MLSELLQVLIQIDVQVLLVASEDGLTLIVLEILNSFYYSLTQRG